MNCFLFSASTFQVTKKSDKPENGPSVCSLLGLDFGGWTPDMMASAKRHMEGTTQSGAEVWFGMKKNSSFSTVNRGYCPRISAYDYTALANHLTSGGQRFAPELLKNAQLNLDDCNSKFISFQLSSSAVKLADHDSSNKPILCSKNASKSVFTMQLMIFVIHSFYRWIV